MIEIEDIQLSNGNIEKKYVFNEYQSELSKENIEAHFKNIIGAKEPYGKEDVGWVHTQIANDLHSIIYLQNLTNPNRRYVEDMPKDKYGKVIVDFANPHILQNMDYFRPLANKFKEIGKYTDIKRSKHPMSKYVRFWKDQIIQSLSNMVREDGEWIPGDLYWYWNFATIYQTKLKEDSKKRGSRIRIAPKTFDGDYLWFHYKERCKEEGQHGSCLKARGKGFSIKESNDLAKNFILGADLETLKGGDATKSYALAESDEFLVKDGILNKFVDTIDWCSKSTEFPKIRKIKDSLSDKHWIMGYKDKQNKTVGSQNEVMGVTLKNDPQKARGKRGNIKWEEVGAMTHFLTSWTIARPSVEDGGVAFGFMVAFGCVCAGTKVWDSSGNLVNIEDLNKSDGILGFDINNGKISKETITYQQPSAKKLCYRIETNTGRILECSHDHPILWGRKDYGEYLRVPKKRTTKFIKKVKFVNTEDIQIGDQLAIAEEVNVFNNISIWESRLLGMLVGDGSYGFNKTPVFSNCDIELNNYIHNNYDTVVEKEYVIKNDKVYQESRIRGICDKLRNEGIYGQSKSLKTLPKNIHSASKHDICEFIGGLFDTDGYIRVGKNPRIILTAGHKSILDETKLLLQKLGIHSNIQKIKKSEKNPIDKNDYFRLDIASKRDLLKFASSISLLVKEKQHRLNSMVELLKNREERQSKNINRIRFERVIKIENIGEKEIYNLTAGNTHTYLANGIVTHNTGGEEMKDFMGLYTAFYEPGPLNIYGIPNVFDRKSSGDKKVGFFFGEYMNRFGCFDENGNSDIIKALIEIYIQRWVVKKASNPNLYIQEKAERSITPQEAVMRKEGSIFPINDLRVYLENDISPDINKFVSPHYIGELEKSLGGELKWKNNTDKNVIRQYPTPAGINKEGCVEIFVQPQKDSSGKIPWGRYIGGIDPYDDDTGTSLGSIFIFDLWTDKIVAEFSGRPRTANEFYEICLRLAEFYNANCNYENNKKGLFTYASNKNALRYLCDTPQILRDTEYVKGILQGNKLKGTNATQGINKYARRLLADWMVKSRVINSENSEGKDEELIILNLHTIRSVGLIQEALIWNEEDNFDRISAMGMLMILRESLIKITESNMNYDDMNESDLLFDPFFTGNYTQDYIEKSFRLSSKLFGDTFDKTVVSNKTSNMNIIDI